MSYVVFVMEIPLKADVKMLLPAEIVSLMCTENNLKSSGVM